MIFISSQWLIAGVHPSKPWVEINYPQDKEKLWWDDVWWDNGQLPTPQNYQVTTEEITYMDGDAEVEAYVFKPTKPGKYPAVLFQHGRRGLDDLVLPRVKRLAARGFIVFAPNVYGTYMQPPMPVKHNEIYNQHIAKGIDVLLQRNDISSHKACVVSHTRGGYMTLSALVSYKKQDKVACYVSYYPHWQNPNAPEVEQVYQYASQLNHLKVPTLVFIGEHEQYQRMRPIFFGIDLLKTRGIPAELIVYPGVGRGFDFRSRSRTFADDLATKDANQRTAAFINKYLNIKK
jgi:carboxymethylenebutenolidase